MIGEVHVVCMINHDGTETPLTMASTSENRAEELIEILVKRFDFDRDELTINTLYLAKTKADVQMLDEMHVEARAIRDKQKEEERLREEYLREHQDEYWDETCGFRKKPSNYWALLEEDDDYWWLHVPVEAYNKHNSYYKEFLSGIGYSEALVGYNVYVKSLEEGLPVNINSVGGYNSFEPFMVSCSDERPGGED